MRPGYSALEMTLKLPRKRWQIAPRVSSGTLRGWPTIIVQILQNRGITDPSEVEGFFQDDDRQILDPFAMKDIERAVDRITEAISRQELVAIYGDFDVDGVTGAALLRDVLASLGARTVTYIPNRAEEGYGVNKPALEYLRAQGVTLLITVDCGISSREEVAFAHGLGVDAIITDHHQVPPQVPDAVAVVNPRQEGCGYPFKELAAVGVAFKLSQALFSRLKPRDGRSASDVLESILDLVALGTVADVAPLLGENRVLVKKGLNALNRTARPGLRELIFTAGLRPGSLTSHSIGYILGPRLNAAGRLQDAFVSYRLLTTDSEEEARILAQELEVTNQERQRLTADALNRARDEIIAGGHVPNLLIVSGAEYPSGIVGLVAGKLMEEFYRPALVVELGDEESRGSARSIAELDITEVLSSCEDLLSRYGGHARAAGFTIPNTNLIEFKDRLLAFMDSKFEGVELQPSIHIDREISFQEISWDLYHLLSSLAPFGYGNPVPTFVTRRVAVAEARAVGRDPLHLRARLTDGRRSWNAIGFGLGEFASTLSRRFIDVVYTLEINEWNEQTSLQINIKDMQLSC